MKEFELTVPAAGKTPGTDTLKEAAAKAMGIKPSDIAEVFITRKSLDARKDIAYKYKCLAVRKGEASPESFSLPRYRDVHDSERTYTRARQTTPC